MQYTFICNYIPLSKLGHVHCSNLACWNMKQCAVRQLRIAPIADRIPVLAPCFTETFLYLVYTAAEHLEITGCCTHLPATIMVCIYKHGLQSRCYIYSVEFVICVIVLPHYNSPVRSDCTSNTIHFPMSVSKKQVNQILMQG